MAITTGTTTQSHHVTKSVTSKDGTAISYQQVGHGPGLVVLHGIMESAQSHIQLAEALADKFTVYLPDRRGRGLSGIYGNDYRIEKEVEDIDALLTQTDAHYVFGVSMGGLICLQACLCLPAIHRAAIFDPPLIIDGSVPTAFLTQYDSEIAQGNVAGALVTAMLGAQMGPPIFNHMPRWLLQLLTRSMMDRKSSNDGITMRILAPTLHYDFQLAVEMEEKQESFKAVQVEVLLLGGSTSPAYFKTALDSLERIIPAAKRIEFSGLGHGASGPTAMGGKPELVAHEIRKFFA